MSLTRVDTPDPDLIVLDGLLEDPEEYRRMALASEYGSHTLGLATFHGIALAPGFLSEWIAAAVPGCESTLSFFRRSPAGQREPNFIHSDRSMGDWTALLYLTPEPPEEDGTTFWEKRESGERASTTTTLPNYAAEGVEWTDLARWHPWYRVPAKFNRLLMFPASYYHSRALAENYGTDDGARLVQIVFGGYRNVDRHISSD